jgi:hypothetical protein
MTSPARLLTIVGFGLVLQAAERQESGESFIEPAPRNDFYSMGFLFLAWKEFSR